MNKIVYPCDQLSSGAQVTVGLTEKKTPPPFLKYGCSVRLENEDPPEKVAPDPE